MKPSKQDSSFENSQDSKLNMMYGSPNSSQNAHTNVYENNKSTFYPQQQQGRPAPIFASFKVQKSTGSAQKPSITPVNEIQQQEQTVVINEERAARNERRLRELKLKRQRERELEEEEFAQPEDPSSALQLGNQNCTQTNADAKPTGRRGGATSGKENIQQQRRERDNTGLLELHTHVGFMPKRGDFNCEYDDEADTLIADVNFVYYTDDNEEEIRYKDSIIELFNARLDERLGRNIITAIILQIKLLSCFGHFIYLRKQFVINRGILDLRRTAKAAEKKRSKEEREYCNALKIFARFNSQEDHEKLVNSVLKERQLREIIDQLKKFQAKGLTSLDQIARFIEVHKRNQSQANSSINQNPMINHQNSIENRSRQFPSFQETDDFLI